MTTALDESEKKDIYKSHIYQLCEFLINERKPPKSINLSLPIEIPLQDFSSLSEYINLETKELKTEKLRESLGQLNSDTLGDGSKTNIITVLNPKILKNFELSYNKNKKIIIKCSRDRLAAYEKKLKELAGEDDSVVKKEVGKKYDGTKEKIDLKVLGVTIEGDVIEKGPKRENINPTDRNIIYFLYYKSIKNEDECFTAKALSETKEIKTSARYIRNRITVINKLINQIISRESNLKIPKFIKKEGDKRGYRLNPDVLHKKTDQ
jgi:hypothetical protein